MTAPHRPRKRFGQHFLHDPAVIARIVAAINPQPGQAMIEIGPGEGALTRPLLQQCGALQAVELDRDLAAALPASLADAGTLEVHQGDALKFDFAALARAPATLRIVGNLPYNISTPLLFHLLAQAPAIQDMHFMLQHEVVERMAASPGNKTYGRLTVMLALHCRVEPLFRIGPGAFRPPPRVQSAIVRLLPHREPPFPVGDVQRFATLVNQAFSRRRKTLRNALSGLLDEGQIRAAGIDPGLRPERLSPAQFGLLSGL